MEKFLGLDENPLREGRGVYAGSCGKKRKKHTFTFSSGGK